MSATITALRTLPRSRALFALLAALTVLLTAAAIIAAAFHGAPVHIPAGAMHYNTPPDMHYNVTTG